MAIPISKQHLYVALLALGAGVLLYRAGMMVYEGALGVLVVWVSALLVMEILLDTGCLLASLFWWLGKNKINFVTPLRFGIAATLLHAVRVLIFVVGRTGPWIDFDVRREHWALHHTRWDWGGVYLAAILAGVSLVGVFIIRKIGHRD
jgi:hypothetical protein